MPRNPGLNGAFQEASFCRLASKDLQEFRMKRRVPRQVQRYPAKLVVTNLNGQPVTDTFLLDISALGAKLESSTPLSLRYPVEVIVLFPGTRTETTFAGLVMWMRPLVASPGRYQMGLKFHQRFWDIDQLGRAGKI